MRQGHPYITIWVANDVKFLVNYFGFGLLNDKLFTIRNYYIIIEYVCF